MRKASVKRKTKETSIAVDINVDGTGRYQIATGIGFLDHMLEQLARHSLMDLVIKADGDTHVDFHHTTEDVGITLGQALTEALVDRKGIRRFGAAMIPMDDALSRVCVDISGRPYLIWKVTFTRPAIGTFDTQLFSEWFRAFSHSAGLTLHVESIYGDNDHHVIESCFKGLAQALKAAVEIDSRQRQKVPSTKGTLRDRRR